MKYVLIGLTIFFLLVPSNVRADDQSDLHFAAHFGMSYSLGLLSYGFYKKAFRMDPTPAFIFAAVTTLTIGYLYKDLEIMNGGTWQSVPRAMQQNVLGVIGAGASILVFQF